MTQGAPCIICTVTGWSESHRERQIHPVHSEWPPLSTTTPHSPRSLAQRPVSRSCTISTFDQQFPPYGHLPPRCTPVYPMDPAATDTDLELYDHWLTGSPSHEQLEGSWPQESLDNLLCCNCSQPWTFGCQCWSSWSDADFSQSQGTDVGSVYSSQSAFNSDGFEPTAASDGNDHFVDKPSTKAKRSRRLSKDAVTTLRTWLNRHKHSP